MIAGIQPMLHHGELDAVGVIDGQIRIAFGQRCDGLARGQRMVKARSDIEDLFWFHGLAHSFTHTLRSSV